MAYDEGLAERFRDVLAEQDGVTETRMFGGLAFLLKGHRCVGVVKHELMVRVGPSAHTTLSQQPHAREMDFTGRPMKGFLYVEPAGFEADSDLRRWLEHGVAHAGSLPAKRALPKNPESRGGGR